MLTDSPDLGNLLFKEIYLNDVYRLNHLAGKDVTTFVDIGANCGFFSMRARALFPKARIIAVEPNPIAQKYLEQNLAHLDIEIRKIGLGNGTPISLSCPHKKKHSGNMMPSSGGELPTATLPTMFQKWNIDPNSGVFLKIDCEGGEQYLLNEESTDLLQRAMQWAMEVHWQSKLRPEMPTFETYNEWLDTIKRDATKYNNRPDYLRRKTRSKYDQGIAVKYNRWD